MDVDRGDRDLQTGAQAKQEPDHNHTGDDGDEEQDENDQNEPAHVELPSLTGSHHHGPADEEAHHREGEQGGLPPHRVHQEDRTQRAEHRPQGEQAAHPRGLGVGDREGGVRVQHGGDGRRGVRHAYPI